MNTQTTVEQINDCTDWQTLMVLKNAIENRLVNVPTPHMSAAEVKGAFAGVKTVRLLGLTDRMLNGMEVPLLEVANTKLVVAINKYGVPQRTRVPAICAMAVTK